MASSTPLADSATADTHAFYRHTLRLLAASGVEFLVGGAYAYHCYTGIARQSKDLDIFLRRADCPRALEVLARAGFRTEVPFPHWLAKAYCGEDFIDIIFSSGNAIARVDDEWFEHAPRGVVLGIAVRLCPPEEMIWSKSYVMERERFDGADIAHVLRACGARLDWARLLRRFGEHWHLLLAHILLFQFSYPGERGCVPRAVIDELARRCAAEQHAPAGGHVCRGTLLSRSQYLVDVEQWNYVDARLQPPSAMTADEIERWTPRT